MALVAICGRWLHMTACGYRQRQDQWPLQALGPKVGTWRPSVWFLAKEGAPGSSSPHSQYLLLIKHPQTLKSEYKYLDHHLSSKTTLVNVAKQFSNFFLGVLIQLSL